VCSSEFEILEQLGAERELGLEPRLLPHIVHTRAKSCCLAVTRQARSWTTSMTAPWRH
jgi:hypothetical protein